MTRVSVDCAELGTGIDQQVQIPDNGRPWGQW